MSDGRLGIFICDCGSQISSTLDMYELEERVRSLPGVAVVQRMRYSCSPDGLAMIRTVIGEQNLSRVVVAGCTPRLLQRRFHKACEEAGLPRDAFELVDIREGCAWVHQNEPQAATSKAVALIRMGIANVVLREPRKLISARVAPGALVIGGGLAGMTAALTLADAGVPVKLVERESLLGGMLRHMHKLYPDGHIAHEFLARRIAKVTSHPNITVLLHSQVHSITRNEGCYSVTVARLGNQEDALQTFDVGAIIVATGARGVPPKGNVRYDGQRVITQLEFERELKDSEGMVPPLARQRGSHGESSDNLRDVVIMPDVGLSSAATSAICCRWALHQAMELKTAYPQTNVTIIFSESTSLNSRIEQTELAIVRQSGVQFICYAPALVPKITAEAVEVYDTLTKTHCRLPYDRVVLASVLLPQPDASVFAHMLNIPQDREGFFPEVRYRLRPENYARRGIYVCGSAHYPTEWREAEIQAVSAAFNALHHLRATTVTSWAPVTVVDEKLCTGCANCVKICAFGAISMSKRKRLLDLSRIDPLLCTGCGNCAVACPSKAIRLPQGSDAQILAQIEAALETESTDGKARVLAFGCEWSGYAAAELAGARKIGYPASVYLIRVGCSARIDPAHILWAFLRGADGVFLGACPPGDCHYMNGNRHAQERINTLRELLAEHGFDQRRLRLEWIVPDDPQDFVSKITDFVSLVEALGTHSSKSGQINQEESNI